MPVCWAPVRRGSEGPAPRVPNCLSTAFQLPFKRRGLAACLHRDETTTKNHRVLHPLEFYSVEVAVDERETGLLTSRPSEFQSSSMVEHAAVNRGVVGSSPTSGANFEASFSRGFCAKSSPNTPDCQQNCQQTHSRAGIPVNLSALAHGSLTLRSFVPVASKETGKMKNRYRMFRRGSRYYLHDGETPKFESPRDYFAGTPTHHFDGTEHRTTPLLRTVMGHWRQPDRRRHADRGKL